MFQFLVILQIISLIVLFGEALYVFFNLNSKMHSFLFLYLIANIVNQAGYLFEMNAKTSEEAYMATRLLYLGKVFIPVGMIIFILHFCMLRIPKWVSVVLCLLHTAAWFLIATNDYHHLFYTSMEFVSTGLFPHNIYGHGPVYYIYQMIAPLYAVIDIAVVLKARRGFSDKASRSQFRIFILSPMIPLVGFGFFLSGITGGYDTTNLGFFITSLLMMSAFFRFNLIDAENVAKDDVVDNLNDGIIATGHDGRLVYFNKRARGLFPGALSDKTDENSDIIRDLHNKAQRKEKIEIGFRVYSVLEKEVIRDDLFGGKLYILDDVTETEQYIRQVEEERERANEANVTKSQFLSNMSHEIRTPMNAIVGMTDIMLRDDLPEADKEYLDNIRNSGNALIDIINDILDFSKIESGKMEILPVEYEPLTLFNDLKVIFLTRLGEKPIRLTYDIDYDLPAKIVGDPVRIRQIVINLVGNAIKFTEVGYVMLKVTAKKKDEDTIILGISVKDSGLGIKKEDLDKLFDSFTRVDAIRNHSKEGTGLGLAITKQLAELMGGDISVQSEYGSGSVFTVNIPQKIADHTPATEYNYQKESADDNNFTAPEARVLVAEDNEINVKVITGLLEPLKMHIDVAENGLAALRKVTDQKYDLVLMDQMMPVMDGIEATVKIREHGGDYFEKLPIIALTANAVQGAREELLTAGMNDYLMKPVDIDALKSKIKKWLPARMVIEDEGNANNADNGNGNISEKKTSDKEKKKVPDEYGYLDKQVGIKHCGSEKLFNEVLLDFFKLIDKKADKIEEYYNDNNISDYTIEVHALKSVARMVGAEYLSELSLELEMAGKENNKELIDEKTPELLGRYRAYKETLSYLDSPKEDKENVSNDVLSQELSKMKEACASFDIDTVDEIMQQINGFDIKDEGLSEKIKDLDVLVRDVSFDDVSKLIDEIIPEL